MSFITIPVRIEGASYKNTAAGYLSLVKNTPGSFPNGEDNTALGYLSLSQNTTGEGNSALGSNSLALNVSGRFNVAIGERASYNNTTGQFNVSVGSTALTSSTNSDYNTAMGYGACGVLAGNVGSNTMIGAGAGAIVTTGAKNTILGRFNGNQGGLDIRTASNYCVISDGDGNPRIIVDSAGLVSAPGGFSGGGVVPITIDNKTAAYTVVSGDLGKIINCTANTFTVSLTSAATLGSGFNCWIWNTGNGTITIDPSGAQTIDGRSTLTLSVGEGMQIVCNGTNWETGDKKTMRGYAEFVQATSSRPSATGAGCIAIGVGAQSAGGDSLAIGSFTIAGNSNTISIGTSTQANPSYSAAIGNNSAGSGSQTATGFGAMSLGGSYASGSDSFAAAVANNTNIYGATSLSAIAMGYLARAQGSYAICLSATSSTASGVSSIAIGDRCTANANAAVALGTSAVSSIHGKLAYSGTVFAANGDVQAGKFVLRRATSNANPGEMSTNGLTPGATNKITLPNNSAYAFSGTIVAMQQASGGTQSAAWRIEGLILRGANAASTTLVASTVTTISNVPGWGLSLIADTAFGGLTIQTTGALATNIRWVGNIDTSEVTYA